MTLTQDRRPPIAFAVAALTAGVQLGIAARWPRASSHLTAVAAAWGAALFSVWLDGRSRQLSTRDGSHVVLGTVLVVGTWLTLVAGRSQYALVNRFLPLVAGVGLIAIAVGLRTIRSYARELILLGIPLVYPLPAAIEDAVMPTDWTAATAGAMVKALGLTVNTVGPILWFPHTSLEVYDYCSGLRLIMHMILLAIVVIGLFPVGLRQSFAVLAAAVSIGFVVNSARIAMLAIVAYRTPTRFYYWEHYVAGSALFPLLAAAFGGAFCYLLLRNRPRLAR